MTLDKSNGRAGIRQIAETLGISIGTVDRVLHGREGVSPKTRDRVMKMAKKLNYSPNIAARNLKLNRHLRVGVYLPKEIASFFDPLRAGIQIASRAASAATFEVIFHSYPRLREGDVEAMEKSDWKQFDGVILAPGDPSRLNSVSMIAQEQNKPLLFVATDAPRIHRLSSIAVEAAVSGGIAAELMGQILPTKGGVAVVTGDLKIHDHAEKLRGFAASLATLSPHLNMHPAIESHESASDAYQKALELLRNYSDLRGIYISTANSMPVLRALEKVGKLGRVRVIATDIFPEMAQAIESNQVFAALHQRPSMQGRIAFDILSRHLISGFVPKRVIRLAPHLILKSNLGLFLDSYESEYQTSEPATLD